MLDEIVLEADRDNLVAAHAGPDRSAATSLARADAAASSSRRWSAVMASRRFEFLSRPWRLSVSPVGT